MKIVLQYVSHAKVTVKGRDLGQINNGYVLLTAFSPHDTPSSIKDMVSKIMKLRTIPDLSDKINLSINDISGNLLIIPQFTLYADTSKGHRPSFSKAAAPKIATKLFQQFVSSCKEHLPLVQAGEFAAHMQVELINNGPITLILDND